MLDGCMRQTLYRLLGAPCGLDDGAQDTRDREVIGQRLMALAEGEHRARVWWLAVRGDVHLQAHGCEHAVRDFREASELARQCGEHEAAELLQVLLALARAREGETLSARETLAGVMADATSPWLRGRAALWLSLVGGPWDATRQQVSSSLAALEDGELGRWLDLIHHAIQQGIQRGDRVHVNEWLSAVQRTCPAEFLGGWTHRLASDAYREGLWDDEVVTCVEDATPPWHWTAQVASEGRLRAGELDEARRGFMRMLGRAHEEGLESAEVDASLLLGMVHLLRGEADEALPRLERARRGCSDRFDPLGAMTCCCLILVGEALANRPDTAGISSMEVRTIAEAPRLMDTAQWAERIWVAHQAGATMTGAVDEVMEHESRAPLEHLVLQRIHARLRPGPSAGSA